MELSGPQSCGPWPPGEKCKSEKRRKWFTCKCDVSVKSSPGSPRNRTRSQLHWCRHQARLDRCSALQRHWTELIVETSSRTQQSPCSVSPPGFLCPSSASWRNPKKAREPDLSEHVSDRSDQKYGDELIAHSVQVNVVPGLLSSFIQGAVVSRHSIPVAMKVISHYVDEVQVPN